MAELSYCKLILPYKFCWAVKPAFQSAVSFTFASTYNLCTLIRQLLCKGAFLYWAVSAGSLWKCISFFFPRWICWHDKEQLVRKKKKKPFLRSQPGGPGLPSHLLKATFSLFRLPLCHRSHPRPFLQFCLLDTLISCFDDLVFLYVCISRLLLGTPR